MLSRRNGALLPYWALRSWRPGERYSPSRTGALIRQSVRPFALFAPWREVLCSENDIGNLSQAFATPILMRNKPRILVGALSASLLALPSGSACAQAAPERLALVGGAVYPSPTDAPIREGVILIDDGKIVGAKRSMKIPRDAEILDCSGTTITDWDKH